MQLYQEISVLSQKLETFKEKEKEIQIKKGTLKKLKILKDNLIFYENFKKFQKEYLFLDKVAKYSQFF